MTSDTSNEGNKSAASDGPATKRQVSAGIGYEAPAVIRLRGYKPQNVTINNNLVTANFSAEEPLDKYVWRTPPHVALANLLTRNAEGNVDMLSPKIPNVDAKAAAQFVREYGFMHPMLAFDATFTGWVDEGKVFEEPLTDIAEAQETVREEWGNARGGHAETVQLDEFKLLIDGTGRLEIWTDSLWEFIDALMAIDSGTLDICENPDCVAPYFKKKRRTQRFCERGPCSAYAARQYSKRWYVSRGKNDRATNRKRKRKA